MARLLGNKQHSAAQSFLERGIALIDQGQFAAAITELSTLATDEPHSAPVHANLGAAQLLSGATQQALDSFNRALNLDPRCWPALINATKIRIDTGSAGRAISDFKKAGPAEEFPNDVLILYAHCLIDTGNFPTALKLLKPYPHRFRTSSEYWLLYGVTCQFLGQPIEAEAALRFLRSLGPVTDDVEARHARMLSDLGEYGQTRTFLGRHLQTKPPSIEAHIAYARLQEVLGENELAIKIYEKILSGAPGNVEVLTNLGNLKKKVRDFTQSESLYRQALTHQDISATLHRNLADLLGKTFRTEEAIAELSRCIKLSPGNPYHLSDLFFAQHYSARLSVEDLKSTANLWGSRHAREQNKHLHPTRVRANPQLRIGLLSGSFRQHPVGFLALPGLEALDPAEYSVVCCANQVGGDSYTERFRTLAQQWRTVAHLTDGQLADLIQEDRIDILIEMAGHASGHRLPVVARRVAPLQIKWIGGQYNTLGIPAIDYFLSDPIESPHDHDPLYIERIHRLSEVYACYEPPVSAPAVSALPAIKNGAITFGSLNKLNKVSPEIISLWSKCLKAVPGSRLLLQGEPFEDRQNIERIQSLFAAHGIEASRLLCRGFIPHPDLFLSYHDIDIALDPHPYSGCLTTCEALWMGVPVITLPGPTFAGRHSASFLNAVGLVG